MGGILEKVSNLLELDMPSYLEDFFEKAGWEVETVKTDPSLIKRLEGGAARCGDGRPFEGVVSQTEKSGYNVFGGTMGLAAMLAAKEGRSTVSLNHLDKAIELENKYGIVSGWHNIHEDEVHCGFEAKQASEGIPGIPAQEFSPAEGAGRIKAAGGKSIDVGGDHLENRLVINLKRGYTCLSNPDDQQFSVDAQMLKGMGISGAIIAEHSANVVKALKPSVNKVRFIV